jgi:hypothetical protein
MQATWEPDEEDRAFCAIYGDWAPLTPPEVAALMEGFEPPWWIVGGYAIEAATGVPRTHEDIDLVVFSRDFAALRAQLSGEFHLWSNFGGTFRFIDDRHPDPLDPLSQIWVRRDAMSPWVMDVPLNPDRDGQWASKRDPELVADLAEVTWVHDDGIRYLRPPYVLHYKSTQLRSKDEIDLGNVLPLLSGDERRWLADAVGRLDPEHPWLERLR